MPRFDIIKFVGENKTQVREDNVHASSAPELIQLYGMCGEEVRIIKQYDDAPPSSIDDEISNMFVDSDLNHPTPPGEVTTTSDHIKETPASVRHFQPIPIPVERVYSVGDQQFKVVGDMLYRLDWTDYEDSDIRIVSEKTNKVISMTGKKIQTKEWIEVTENDNT